MTCLSRTYDTFWRARVRHPRRHAPHPALPAAPGTAGQKFGALPPNLKRDYQTLARPELLERRHSTKIGRVTH